MGSIEYLYVVSCFVLCGQTFFFKEMNGIDG